MNTFFIILICFKISYIDNSSDCEYNWITWTMNQHPFPDVTQTMNSKWMLTWSFRKADSKKATNYPRSSPLYHYNLNYNSRMEILYKNKNSWTNLSWRCWWKNVRNWLPKYHLTLITFIFKMMSVWLVMPRNHLVWKNKKTGWKRTILSYVWKLRGSRNNFKTSDSKFKSPKNKQSTIAGKLSKNQPSYKIYNNIAIRKEEGNHSENEAKHFNLIY